MGIIYSILYDPSIDCFKLVSIHVDRTDVICCSSSLKAVTKELRANLIFDVKTRYNKEVR